ncbi:VCBS repeat-containing protein [Flavobacteriaceae bacterium]|nr:VCBS repeat-containing protein [Flavobacteriaceae bacterium]
MNKTLLFILSLLLVTCAKDSTEDNSSVYIAPPTNTTNPTPTPTVTQYTITVSAGEGGSVSTAGGTYNDGTSISITATPSEGYGFIGWNGSDSTSPTISVTLSANTTIEAIFGQVPQFTLPETPSKMFTKGVGDTLSIGFSHAGGYKTTSLSAEYGNVSVISEPNEGDTEGNITIEYTVNTVENVDWTTTIAGTDDIEINFTGVDNLSVLSNYQVRTQPEPIYKDYLKSSHDLFATRNKADVNLVRYLNQRDNRYEDWCNGVYEGFNQNGNSFDELDGVAYADINNDGYDDIFIHPTYQAPNSFTLIQVEFELYLYDDGSYVYTEIDWGGKDPLKRHLARKILVGDFDNDGDPDFYSANLGLDIPPYTGENNSFIINNYNVDGTFDYKIHDLLSGSHEASSGDIDNDGDLDIFSVGSRDNAEQKRFNSKFFENQGAFNFPIWEDRMETQYENSFWYWRSTYHSELVDVDKDGNIDLLVMGHEWDYYYDWCQDNADGNCGRGKIYWGDEDAKFSEDRKSLIPIVRNFGTSTDFDVVDLDGDGVNEIIVSRTGGDIDSFPIESSNMNDNIGTSNFYGGHYIQINKLDSERNIIDYTDQLIENSYLATPGLFCSNPETGWFIQTRVEDYEGDGTLNIFNSLVSHKVQHIWEWNGSKFVKTGY